MAYEPKKRIEKILFFLAGVKRASPNTLLPQELNAVVNYWLTLSNTSTVFSTIFLTVTVALFIETTCWYLYSLTFVGAIIFGIKTWVYAKCAEKTLSLWK